MEAGRPNLSETSPACCARPLFVERFRHKLSGKRTPCCRREARIEKKTHPRPTLAFTFTFQPSYASQVDMCPCLQLSTADQTSFLSILIGRRCPDLTLASSVASSHHRHGGSCFFFAQRKRLRETREVARSGRRRGESGLHTPPVSAVGTGGRGGQTPWRARQTKRDALLIDLRFECRLMRKGTWRGVYQEVIIWGKTETTASQISSSLFWLWLVTTQGPRVRN